MSTNLNNRETELLNARLERVERVVSEIRQLVGPFGVNFPNEQILVQTIYGLKYFVDALDEIMTPQLIVYRQWEEDLSAFVLNSVTKDTCFLDVGANFGYFTCLAASRIGQLGAGGVIAVEPNPRMFELLSRNVGINWSMSQVETHRCAATNDHSSVDLVIPRSGAANASLVLGKGPPMEGSGAVVHVRARTIDSIVSGRKLDLMKIDVEGHELRVLEGSLGTLAANPHLRIVMEWSLGQMREAGVDPIDLLDLLESFGYAAYQLPISANLSGPDLAALRLTRSELLETGYANIYLSR